MDFPKSISYTLIMLFPFRRFFCAFSVTLFLGAVGSCSRIKPPVPPPPESEEALPDLAETLARLSAASDAGTSVEHINAAFAGILEQVLRSAALPAAMSQRLVDGLTENPAFILDLFTCMGGENDLRRLVDKQHPLPGGYEPADLVELRNSSYKTGRAGLMLRKAAAESLDEMAAAAKTEGIILVVSSAYRSYNYQTEVYNRIVREMGQEAADRESARPGYSQHQTGLTADFGSIDDSFAQTPAGRWMAANASRFGWSLSFPRGYEAVTGYRWESWHYRYVGRDLAAFIDAYFEGIQQYALRFIHEWEALTS